MTPDYCLIGKRIKEIRVNKKLKQEDLADKLDISIAFMSRVETGNAKINLKRLTQIAEILETTPGYLLTGNNIESKEKIKGEFNDIFDKCTPEQQKLIYGITQLVYKAFSEE